MSADALKKIDEKLDQYNEGVIEVQKRIEKIETDNDSLDKDALQKAANDVTQAISDINEVKTQIASIEKTNEFIEKTISRMGSGEAANSEIKELEAKSKKATVIYLRNRQAMSEETCLHIAKAIAEKRIIAGDADELDLEVKKLVAGVDPQGGYWIRPELSNLMVKRIFEISNIRALANVVTTNSDSFEMIVDDNEADSGGWVGETASREAETDTPDIGKLTIPIHEQFAQPQTTQKMLDDAGFDVESWLSGKVISKMSRVENTAFIRGDGSQKPKGILALPAWATAGTYERNALERIDSGTNGQYSADQIIAQQNSLKEDYQANANWGVKRDSFTRIMQLKDSQGRYLINPVILREGFEKILLGKPVAFMDDLDNDLDSGGSPVTNAEPLIYGDFRQGYTIVDRFGFRVIRDNVTKKGFVKFYTTKRTGGAVTNFEAIKIQRLAA